MCFLCVGSGRKSRRHNGGTLFPNEKVAHIFRTLVIEVLVVVLWFGISNRPRRKTLGSGSRK